MNRRNVFLALAFMLLLFGGFSVFGAPSYEVLYHCQENFRSCPEKGACIAQVSVAVGNTGRKAIEKIEVVLAPAAQEQSLFPLSVKNRAAYRRHTIEDREGFTVVVLPNFEPEEMVYISLSVNPDRISEENLCQILLKKVESSQGKVRQGHAEGLRFLRLVYFLFGQMMKEI